MPRTNTVALNDEEKRKLDAAKDELFRTPSVPYGEVVSEVCDMAVQSDVSRDTDHDNSGGKPSYTDEDFIRVITENNRPSNSEITEAIGCTPQTTGNRLDKLEEQGRITSEKDGRSKRWALTNDE